MKKRLTSMVLTAAMLLSLLPAIGGTARAACDGTSKETAFEISSWDDLSAALGSSTSSNEGGEEISAATVAVSAEGYSGEYDGKWHKITVTAPDGLIVRYCETSDGTYNIAELSYKAVGTYTVYYRVYQGNDVIDEGSETVEILQRTASLSWRQVSFTYNGTEKCPAATVTNLVEGESCAVTVTGGGTETGSYTAEATALSNSNYRLPNDGTTVTFTINKANAEVTTRPTPLRTLIYTGEPQELVIAGVSSSGVMVYQVGSRDGPWSEEIPTGIDAGYYNIWYKAGGNSNYNESYSSVYYSQINKANLTGVSVNQSGTLTYNGSAQTPEVTTAAVSVNSQPVTFTYSTTRGAYGDMPSFTDAGSYTVYYKASAPNHNDATGSFTVTIAPKPLTDAMVTLTNTNIEYTGSALSPEVTVKDGSTTLTEDTHYILGGDTSKTDFGDYTLTVTGTGNYTGTVNKAWSITKEQPTLDGTLSATAITYGQTLADSTVTGAMKNKSGSTVAGTFAWETSTIVPTVSDSNSTEYNVTFTPSNSADYDLVTLKVMLAVDKATPTIATKPTASEIGYGQTLADSSLTGGKAENPHNDDAVAGTFAWTASDTQPNSVGTFDYSVTFTPTDTANYNTATATVTLTVNKAARDDVTVTFDSDGGSAVAAQTVESGGSATRPTDPTRNGYTFSKWQLDGVDYDFSTFVTENITLKAVWTANSTPTPSDDDYEPTYTVTAPVSGDENTVHVAVSVTGTAATLRSADIEKALSGNDKTGTVEINVSGLKQDITSITIPAKTVSDIAAAMADESNATDSLTVKLTDGTVTFDAAAVAAIAGQTGSSSLKLNLDNIRATSLKAAQRTAVAELEVESVYDAYMTANGRRITDFKGGSATVTVTYALKDGQAGRGVVVWYVAEDGAMTAVPTVYDAETVRFTIEHFSNYVVAYDEVLAAVCPQDETCPIAAFADADPAAWYHDEVHYVLENGVMSGYGGAEAGKFGPNDTTSRAMMAQILWNLEGRPAVNDALRYTDVDAGKWYAGAIRWATAEGIMNGYGNGLFGPDDAMTREQLAAIVHRYAIYKGADVSVASDLLGYTDQDKVSAWALPSMRWAVGSGAVLGRTDTTLDPKDSATRAEIATIIKRYCTEISK